MMLKKILLYLALIPLVFISLIAGLFLIHQIQEMRTGYAVKGHYVYYQSLPMLSILLNKERLHGADVATFEVVNDTFNIAKDKNTFYHKAKSLKEIDTQTGEFLGHYYLKDHEKVWYHYREQKGVDAPSFRVLTENYALDKNAVYYNRKLIKQADPSTFSIIDWVYSKDAKGIYYKEFALENVNPDEFETIGESKYFTSLHYGRDAAKVYLRDSILHEADPKSFELTYDNLFLYDAKDKKHRWKMGKRVD